MEVTEEKKIQAVTNLGSVPLNHPRINGLLGIENENSLIPKGCSRCNRFSLKLFLPDDKTFPEFDYQTLLKGKGNDDGTSGNEKNNFEDDAELKALAQKFEEKYAPSTYGKGGKKTSSSRDEFIDVGYGYDESDNFIDNSEAYDEIVPSDWTTEHGGFYINQGNLDYRPVSNTSSDASKKDQNACKKKKKKKLLDGRKIHKIPKELSTQKKKRQLLNKEKQRKRQESLQKAHKILVKKNKKTPVNLDDSSSQDVPLAKLNCSAEDNLPLSKLNCSPEDNIPLAKLNSSADDNIPLAKIARSSGILAVVSSTPNIKSIEKCNTLDSTALEKQICPAVSTSDAIVPSSSSKTSQEETKSNIKPSTITNVQNVPLNVAKDINHNNKENVKTSIDKVFTSLPEDLSEELQADIKQLKHFAEIYVKGKGFFTADVNKVMLSFARMCRQLSPKKRNAIYDHMLCYLPCARDTLVKRCRRLVVQNQRDMEDEPVRILKKGIDDSMSTQKKTYDTEVAKVIQEQAREQIKQTGVDPMKSEELNEISASDDGKKNNDEAKRNFPKKKYIWCDNVRKLLCDVLQVRVGLFRMSKCKSLTAEEYIKEYLESEIRKLWPKGWMTSRILYKESRAAHQEITQTVKGTKKMLKIGDAPDSITSFPDGGFKILKSGVKDPVITSSTAIIVTNKTVSSGLNLFTKQSPSNQTVSSGMNLFTKQSPSNQTVSSGMNLFTKQSPSNQTVSSGMNLFIKQSTSPTLKTGLQKSFIKSASPVTNVETNPMNNSNVSLSIANTSTMTLKNMIVSNSLVRTIPSPSTVITMHSQSGIPHKNLASSKTLSANLKRVIYTSVSTPGQKNARFMETIEKTNFMKPESVDDMVKQSGRKVDSNSSFSTLAEYPKNFVPMTTALTSCTGDVPCNSSRSNTLLGRNTTISHYAITPTYINNTNPSHNDETYYRQVKRKLPADIVDSRNVTPKRNICDKNLHNSVSPHSKSLELKSWSEIESDLGVRLSHEAPRNFIKEEPPSSDSATVSWKPPDYNKQGKEWSSPSAIPSYVTKTQLLNAKIASQSSAEALQKTGSSNIKIEPPIFATDTLNRKNVAVVSKELLLSCQSATNQNSKYIYSHKHSSLHNYQMPGTLISNAKPVHQVSPRKSPQLFIKTSPQKTSLDLNISDYPMPQHPASRIQPAINKSISKSDHLYSTSFENNEKIYSSQNMDPSEQHNILNNCHPVSSPHGNVNNISPMLHNQHLNHQQVPTHGLHDLDSRIQGKLIGIQSLSQQNHGRPLEEHRIDPRISRTGEDYQKKFETYAPRFS